MLVFLLPLWGLVVVPGCRRSKADAVLRRSMELVDGAIDLLEQHRGDGEAAEKALRRYIAKVRPEVRSLRVHGKEGLAELSAEERERFRARAQRLRAERMARMEAIARTFDAPERLLRLLNLVN